VSKFRPGKSVAGYGVINTVKLSLISAIMQNMASVFFGGVNVVLNSMQTILLKEFQWILKLEDVAFL